MRFGPQLCGDLDTAARREWLVADGLGGFAMGTAAGLRTRRYHGLLVVATRPPGGRMLGLAALDPVLTIGSNRIRLAVHEWDGGAVDPQGHTLLKTFSLEDGVPRWRWQVGDVVVERELAMARGRPLVAVIHRVLRASEPVRLELSALCTWRDAHGQRGGNGPPQVDNGSGGFAFEGAYTVVGPGFQPAAEWYRGVRYRVEAERGLPDQEDLWHAGTFTAELGPGQELGVAAWGAGRETAQPPPPAEVIAQARARARQVALTAKSADATDAILVQAADQLLVEGPTVVAGYPWFGDWSRDTMTSYEGLLLCTGRLEEGRALLLRAAGTISEGMLANTADVGGTEYNTADGTLWFLHAAGRHVEATGDLDLARALQPAFEEVIARHLDGTRYGIRVDPADGLLAQGQEGLALTWMDARVDGVPVTHRAGKAVEVNALWIEGLASVAAMFEELGVDADRLRSLEHQARASFRRRFWRDGVCLDVVDGPDGDSGQLRPNCLLAVSLPYGPLRERALVEACARQLLTPLGLRSLSPADPAYAGLHQGDQRERDRAYHQGTVWPWLIGPYAEAARRVGVSTEGLLDGLEAHLQEWGLGSVSETADGDAPHAATGCPFQAWSVAELLRARRLLTG